jgi:LCP family protein required for cell wall assembly
MRIPGWLFVIGIILFVGLTGLLSVLAFSVARQIAIDSANIIGQPLSIEQLVAAQPTATSIPATATPAPTTAPGETAAPTAQATATLDPAAQYVWTDPRRINILLLGIDQRTALNETGPFRTDTMMLVSVNPVAKTAGVLSIPRDLWVNIPGYQPGRINTANALGDANGYPGGGPALAAETVRQTLGMPVDKYILINFDVFLSVVNTVSPDGTEICVREVIDDPHYPDAGFGTIHVHFDPGCQILDAEQLLQYARTRATQGSDFDRAARQQEVLRALRDKVLSVGGIAAFIGQAPALWEDLADSVKTNLTLDEILKLGSLLGEIPKDGIQFGVINNLYVDLASTSSGDQVLVPKLNAMRLLIEQVFNPPRSLSLSELRSRAEAENASIVVFNNTDVAGVGGANPRLAGGQGCEHRPGGQRPHTQQHQHADSRLHGQNLDGALSGESDGYLPGSD